MRFLVTIRRGYVRRTVEVEAPHGAAARALGEQLCCDGESIAPAAHAVMLASQRVVEAMPQMPPDHARNVAEGPGDRYQQEGEMR